MEKENDGFVPGPRAGYFSSNWILSYIAQLLVDSSWSRFLGAWSLQIRDKPWLCTYPHCPHSVWRSSKNLGTCRMRRRTHFKEHRLSSFHGRLAQFSTTFLFPRRFLRFCEFYSLMSLNFLRKTQKRSVNKDLRERKWVIIFNLTMTCFLLPKGCFKKYSR